MENSGDGSEGADYCLDFSDIVGDDANNEEEAEEEESVGAREAALDHLGAQQQQQGDNEILKRGFGSYSNCSTAENDGRTEFCVVDGFNLYKTGRCKQEQLPTSAEDHQVVAINHQVTASLLRLNYDDILSSWCDDRSLWTDGKRPQTVPEHFAAFTGPVRSSTVMSDFGLVPDLAVTGSVSSQANSSTSTGDLAVEDIQDSRVARVTRYREKKRSRLFAKKIRYEVRKVNAESRPRMKGRFVKRTSKSTVLQRL